MCDKTIVIMTYKHNDKLGIIYDLSVDETKTNVCTKEFWKGYDYPIKAEFYCTVENDDGLEMFLMDYTLLEEYFFSSLFYEKD